MMTTFSDNTSNQEIIRKTWPHDIKDAVQNHEEYNWDILNENNSEGVLKRHWFKQNYINQFPQHDLIVTYH